MLTVGAVAEQFHHSLEYWGRSDEEMTPERKAAFLAFLDTLPFDVFLTNPVWGD